MLTSFNGLVPGTNGSGKGACGFGGIGEWCVRAAAEHYAAIPAFRQAGYRTLLIDDGWMDPNRTASGEIQPHRGLFPSGMSALVRFVQRRGFELGIYTDIGKTTCGGHMASQGHYEQDAQTFASWNISYVKMDFCGNDAGLCGSDGARCYEEFARALNATGKRIMFHMCSWGTGQPNNWTATAANLWRTSADGQRSWESYMRSFDNTKPTLSMGGPGGWVLADGFFFDSNAGGLTPRERQTLLSLWGMMPSAFMVDDFWPALAANSSAVSMYTDPRILSINQDPLGQPMRLLDDSQPGGSEYSLTAVLLTAVLAADRCAVSPVRCCRRNLI